VDRTETVMHVVRHTAGAPIRAAPRDGEPRARSCRIAREERGANAQRGGFYKWRDELAGPVSPHGTWPVSSSWHPHAGKRGLVPISSNGSGDRGRPLYSAGRAL